MAVQPGLYLPGTVVGNLEDKFSGGEAHFSLCNC